MSSQPMLWVMLACAGAGWSCASSGSPPPAPPPGPSAEPAVADSTKPEPAPEPVASAAEPKPPPETTPSDVAKACDELCARVEKACSELEYLTCRGRCTTYLVESAYCEDEIKQALECHSKASDAEICASFAAERCYSAFVAVRACQRAEKSSGQATVASAGPPGWKIVVDEKLGFAMELPPNAEPSMEGGHRIWRGRDGRVSYYVASVPPPSDVSDGKLLRVALEHVGPKCQRGFRMRGRFDSGGLTGVSYSTSCEDGSKRQGTLRIRGDRALVIGFRAPPGEQADLDPALSTFELFEQ